VAAGELTGRRTDECDTEAPGGMARRTVLKWGAASSAGAALVVAGGLGRPYLEQRGWLSADGAFNAASTALADQIYIEAFPTSPLILKPFTDDLLIPPALKPIKATDLTPAPGPGLGQQNSYGNETHQLFPGISDVPGVKESPDPIIYLIECLVRTHSFTTSPVLPIDKNGRPVASFDGAVAGSTRTIPAGTQRTLPPSTIYGFNGTFPGPRINAEYGHPALVRFSNRLDENPLNLDRQDFGSPDYSFLTHLHNGHTAPESDGNPHYSMTAGPQHEGFRVKDWVDQLYLNWPAGNDDSEKQSFFWFHDHRMDHTGSNVYKGMVGLYPIYDPKPMTRTGFSGGMDMGDETKGLRLPGVRRNLAPDGTPSPNNAVTTYFEVDYDIPLALFDCRLDDGVTIHQDIHDTAGEFPAAGNPRTHPEWWGKTFYKHFPSHGFVGDIFTVNGTAYPTLTVKRRKYRFRFLDASLARIYELKLMSSTNGPKTATSLGFKGDDMDGQYRIPDGQQCMRWTQIANDGGLLPFALTRDSFELWPAKRREFIVDFTKYQDGHPTTKGDVIYLTNVLKMPTGRMWSNSSRFSPDPAYKVPMLKFVIGDVAQDDSLLPGPNDLLRELPPLPSNWRTLLDQRTIFEVKRGSAGGEIEWLINGQPFNPTVVATSLKNPAKLTPLALQKKNSFNLWEIRNGGGGWVHPFHLHMEEHRTVMRNGKDVTVQGSDTGHPDDVGREDLVALDPSESVILYRGFRDFVGPYVAHCHNLAHEDHAMMFGWAITK
jgi:FtsP/CotA-like multicopper oxidase with cupredoxin domain